MQKRRPDPALDLDPTRRAIGLASVIAVVVIVVDQLTKSWAEGDRLTYPGIHLLGPARLARTYNEGVAFGLGPGFAPYLVPLVIVGILFALFYGRQMTFGYRTWSGVGLMLGGAFGNLGDRLFRDHNGAVVDFIEAFGWFPVFNVADACVTVGAIMLVIHGMRHESQKDQT